MTRLTDALGIDVPIVLVGEAKDVLSEQGVIDQQLFSLPISAKPGTIPNELVVSAAALTLGLTGAGLLAIAAAGLDIAALARAPHSGADAVMTAMGGTSACPRRCRASGRPAGAAPPAPPPRRGVPARRSPAPRPTAPRAGRTPCGRTPPPGGRRAAATPARRTRRAPCTRAASA